MAIAGPRYVLADVQALVAKGEFHVSQKSAAARIISILACTQKAAREYAAKVICSLVPDNYCETVRLSVDVADVYGVVVAGDAWYIKFCIDPNGPNGDEVSVISFHPPLHAMRTKAATIKP